jgi:hypothetical protein
MTTLSRNDWFPRLEGAFLRFLIIDEFFHVFVSTESLPMVLRSHSTEFTVVRATASKEECPLVVRL